MPSVLHRDPPSLHRQPRCAGLYALIDPLRWWPSRPLLAPLYVKRVSFPPGECVSLLVVVKQTSLDNDCGPALIEGRRELAGERIGLLTGAGVGLLAAGPGSDFSEEPVQGSEPATLEPVAVPVCPPGPVARRFASARICW